MIKIKVKTDGITVRFITVELGRQDGKLRWELTKHKEDAPYIPRETLLSSDPETVYREFVEKMEQAS